MSSDHDRPTIDVDRIEAAKAAAGPRPPASSFHGPRTLSLEELDAHARASERASLARRADELRRHRRRAWLELIIVALLLVLVLTVAGVL